jgi:hypothetical protein
VKKVLVAALALLSGSVVVTGYGLARFFYPADLIANEAAYNWLVNLTLSCCTSGDYMAGADQVDPQRRQLMQQLGIDRVHYYGGNVQSPGPVVYLERNLAGPLSTMYGYSVEGGPKSITSCYTSAHIKGHWYRSHSLPCLFRG